MVKMQSNVMLSISDMNNVFYKNKVVFNAYHSSLFPYYLNSVFLYRICAYEKSEHSLTVTKSKCTRNKYPSVEAMKITSSFGIYTVINHNDTLLYYSLKRNKNVVKRYINKTLG